MALQFDPRLQRYRDIETGRIVRREVVLREVDNVTARVNDVIQKRTTQLFNKSISVQEWQESVQNALREGANVSAAISAGGKKQLTKELRNKLNGVKGAHLRNQYERLNEFAKQIQAGELSESQIRARATFYAQSNREIFNLTEKTARGEAGFSLGKRWLDPGARHCSQCPGYSTGGEWVPIEDIVPPGHDCDCRGRCKCSVAYKRE